MSVPTTASLLSVTAVSVVSPCPLLVEAVSTLSRWA